MKSPCNVLLIVPRFLAGSFWDYRVTCQALGTPKMPTIPLGLITVAGMLPDHWNCRLIDHNCEDFTDDDLAWADLVMTGGMFPQQRGILSVVDRCRSLGVPVAVGGADVSSSPHVYDRADFRVVGEAELVIDDFLAAWEAGERSGYFEADKFKADVTRTPVPRHDLLKLADYQHIGIQFSRGCPFNCEFCDIIELYGRVPRTKTSAQVLAELDSLRAVGFSGHVDFVDDNLIGNKKAIKAFLPDLIAWQKAHGYPFDFTTQASVNLSDDDELLSMLRDAGFFAIFLGIESPDADTLVATQKKQNTRRGLVESVDKIHSYGILVMAGFIIGFDSEKGSIAQPMIDFIEAANIPASMVGLLYALPNTQLTRRLEREGRLFVGFEMDDRETPDMDAVGDQCTSGLNFVTVRPRREILTDLLRVVEHIYEPRVFFERVRRAGRMIHYASPRETAYTAEETREGIRLAWYILTRHPRWIIPYVRTVVDCVRHNPGALKAVASMIALYLHLGPFARAVAKEVRADIRAIDEGAWTQPPVLSGPLTTIDPVRAAR